MPSLLIEVSRLMSVMPSSYVVDRNGKVGGKPKQIPQGRHERFPP
jgi:hypothetical protein